MPPRAFTAVEVKPAPSVELDAVEAPTWLRLDRLDAERAIELRVAPTVEFVLVPPAGLLAAGSFDPSALAAPPRSWMLVQTDEFGNRHGLEVELGPAEEGLELCVRRGAHRLVASGTAAIDRGNGVRFELTTVGGTPKRRQVSFRGTLGTDGALTLESTLAESA